MAKHAKFKPGVSGCREKQFQPGNPHRWQPGQSRVVRKLDLLEIAVPQPSSLAIMG
jgi:hypothetical protein